MRAYNFYFDESSHDFRISNKTILDSEDYSDSYVGMWGQWNIFTKSCGIKTKARLD